MRKTKQRLQEYGNIIEAHLQTVLDKQSIPSDLSRAMDYSLSAGGKRLRPVLCLVWAELFGQDRELILDFATSLELIHTYSLIHDDLPAIDNDDYRRGQPSNHIQFGEAMSILAGDALLTEAFRIMLNSQWLPAERVNRAAAEVASSTGAGGMVGGQAIDMSLSRDENIQFQALKQMHCLKTAELIKVSCLSGGILAGAGRENLDRVSTYGTSLGLAFQVTDDILDIVGDKSSLGKAVGRDQEQGKVTYSSLLGLEKSRQIGKDFANQARDAIQHYRGEQAEFLRDLSDYIIERIE